MEFPLNVLELRPSIETLRTKHYPFKIKHLSNDSMDERIFL
ncbi:hypothetical protein FHS57_000905 [Runella defluvii]|uniref:Uncharacterized protein n=1 Tax=Runella defluvii TaxID=370973 RepID=A0A7W6ENY9_9BACT|nr:hypothetical protein [Runella defluvii]MBB3836923.1 hypothetical protein [Runella defluvii]